MGFWISGWQFQGLQRVQISLSSKTSKATGKALRRTGQDISYRSFLDTRGPRLRVLMKAPGAGAFAKFKGWNKGDFRAYPTYGSRPLCNLNTTTGPAPKSQSQLQRRSMSLKKLRAALNLNPKKL